MKHFKAPLIAVLLLSAATAIAQPRLTSYAVGANVALLQFKSISLPGYGLDATLALDNHLVFSTGYSDSEHFIPDLSTPLVPSSKLRNMQTTTLLAGYRFKNTSNLVFDCMAGLAVSTYEERVIYGSEPVENGWFPFDRLLSYDQTITQISPELRARAHWLFTRYTGLHMGFGALVNKSTATYFQLGLTFGKLR